MRNDKGGYKTSAGAESLDAILESIRRHPGIAHNITKWETVSRRSAEFADFPEKMDPRLRELWRGRGIERLYSHQAEAIETALDGRDLTIVTPTASGKSLCFHAPILQSALASPMARSLLLFPTKALAQDQLGELSALTKALKTSTGKSIKPATFDGDTPSSRRSAVRSSAQIVISNPDMLHIGILPQHANWAGFFQNLRWVVLDEVHTYRGVFGSHIANLLRRLDRVCAFHGARPQYICCSATIANPGELAEKLTGRPMRVVDRSGSPRGEKAFLFYNPPIVNAQLGIRRSSVKEARRLAMRFLRQEFQTILFARSRLRVEVLTSYLKRAMRCIKADPERVKGYRGGYLAKERRAVEAEIRSGKVLGIVSTSALELGIDIGELRVAVLCGYPGSIASTWQQAGRAGRASESSVVLLVGSSAPLDQFLLQHPDYFFGASHESAIINPDNEAILKGHLRCAVFELPFIDGEMFGNIDPTSVLKELTQDGELHHKREKYFWAQQSYPAQEVSLRNIGGEPFVVTDMSDDNRVLARVDAESAPSEIHPGAIYLHQANAFFIDNLDFEQRAAFALPTKTDYYTVAIAKTDLDVLSVEHRDPAPSDSPILLEKAYGEIDVRSCVTGFKKIRFETHEILGVGDLDMPERAMRTEAWWMSIRPEAEEAMKREGLDLRSGLWGVANLLENVMPLFVLCDRRDFRAIPILRPVQEPMEEDWTLPEGINGESDSAVAMEATLYLYDHYPGGIGLVKRAREREAELFQAASEIVRDCLCLHGCPSCVGPGTETTEREKKRSAEFLIRNMVGGRD